jgi:hypothetical protein
LCSSLTRSAYLPVSPAHVYISDLGIFYREVVIRRGVNWDFT